LPSSLDRALQEQGIFVGTGRLRIAAERAAIAAESTLPVLLLGETGTGKERFAQMIHRLSSRRDRNLIAINCSAIPREIAESYLFGHIKGAFTGAISDKKGVFEDADHTTLFLDEIGELPIEIQAKFLRVIQEGVVQRVGSTLPHRVDVRFIAATNLSLREEVARGRFRQDLYFRLEVIQIDLPPLRDRLHEIPELALTLLEQINRRRLRPSHLSKQALERLEQYSWPGNVRELSNVLERSALYARTDNLDPSDLLIPDDTPAQSQLACVPDPVTGFLVEEYLAEIRRQLFLRALAKSNGNQTHAAALLGVSKQALSRFVSNYMSNQRDES